MKTGTGSRVILIACERTKELFLLKSQKVNPLLFPISLISDPYVKEDEYHGVFVNFFVYIFLKKLDCKSKKILQFLKGAKKNYFF